MAANKLKTKTRQEVAAGYGISVKTLNRRLKKANIVIEAGIIFPSSLKTIYDCFGTPQMPKKS